MTKTTGKITLQDVATAAGVSRGAACAALKGGRSSTTDVSRELMARVQQSARQLGYVPNAAARSLRSRHVPQIGVILPNMREVERLASPQSFETIMGINHELQEGDYVLTLARLHDILETRREGMGSLLFKEHMINVAVAVGQFPDEAEAWIRKRIDKIVWCDGRLWEDTCCVRRDERAAGCLAATKTLAAGHRAVLMLVNDPANLGHQHFSYALRLAGAEAACAEAGASCRVATWDELMASPASALSGAAVLTLSFDMAERAYVALAARGLLPGRDLSLVSCDNYNQQWWCFQDIARVDFDRAAMGAAAARMALAYETSGERPVSTLLPSAWREPVGGNTLIPKTPLHRNLGRHHGKSNP